MTDPDKTTQYILDRIEAIRKRAQERAATQQKEQENAAEPAPAPVKTAEVIPFPGQWGEEVRGTPDICLRSALFGVVRPGRRKFLKNELLASQEGYEVRYTGERLDQGDLDVWQQVVHLCRDELMGTRAPISLYSILKAIGRNTGKSDYQWLKQSLTRLRAHAVQLRSGSRLYVGGLIDDWHLDEDTGAAYVRINPMLGRFFETDQYTLIDFQRRLSIGTQLARWLHDYYSTHAKPYPVKVDTLRRLCGSETSALREFRRNLRSALNELVQAGLLLTWEIDEDDLVHVNKNPTPSQGRHLIRKIIKTIKKPGNPKE